MSIRSWLRAGLAGGLMTVMAAPGHTQAQEALDGADPVLLVQGKDVLGKPEFKVVRGRFEYLFASAETKAIFEGDPARYEIQLGGLCARMGRTTTGNPSDYLVHEGRIYVFGSDECHKRFAASPGKYLPPPAAAMPTAAEALRQGRVSLDQAAAAVGASLDGVNTLVETSTQIQKRMQGDVTVAFTTTWRFPDAVKVERTMNVPGRTMAFATVLSGGRAWSALQGRAIPIVEAGRASVEQEQARRALPLLRLRQQAGFSAAALDRGTVQGVLVDRVRVHYQSLDAIVGLDPSSRRLQTISYVDRNADGEYGGYTVVYSDWRPVSGLMVPFKADGYFNGQPDSFESRTIDSVVLNPPVDAAAFTPPSGK